MQGNRASKRKHPFPPATGPTTAQLRGAMPRRRTPGKTSAEDPAAAPFDTDDEAAGTPAQQAVIEQEIAEQQARISRAERREAIGPVGRTVLLIGLAALAGLLAIWLLLAL
jgi:hypothetical protein